MRLSAGSDGKKRRSAVVGKMYEFALFLAVRKK
jgi:hypothetical protein